MPLGPHLSHSRPQLLRLQGGQRRGRLEGLHLSPPTHHPLQAPTHVELRVVQHFLEQLAVPLAALQVFVRTLDHHVQLHAPTPRTFALLLAASGLPPVLLDLFLLDASLVQHLLPHGLAEPLRSLARLPCITAQLHRAVAVHPQRAALAAHPAVAEEEHQVVAPGTLVQVAALVEGDLETEKCVMKIPGNTIGGFSGIRVDEILFIVYLSHLPFIFRF